MRIAALVAAFVAVTGASASGECTAPAPDAPIPAVGVREIASGLASPVEVVRSPDGRTLVVEQRGTVRELVAKAIIEPPYLDLSERIEFEPGSEKGLLGLAFHPQFVANGRLFTNSTRRTDSGKLKTFVTELRVAPDFSRADPASERALFKVKQPFDNHNGGQLAFGPDGFLYVGLGDGGSANDPFGNAQSLGTRLGKILRVDVDQPSDGRKYGIPSDNPFTGVEGAHPTIWALGFRNPWRLSFDAATGELYAGDVGQGAREEIDLVVRGGNYGWNVLEGTLCTPGVSPPGCDARGFIPPIAEYGHDQGCSVSGGFVYRGDKVPGLCGVYLYGDFCSGLIFGIRQSGGRRTAGPVVVSDSGLRISGFGAKKNGEVRVVDHRGAIHKIVAAD